MVGTRGVLLFVAAGFVANPASAGTISMRTEVSAVVTGKRLAVTIKVVNAGDEAAHSVVAAAALGVQTTSGPKAPSLLQGAALRVPLELSWTPASPGRWPLVTTVDYTDVNGHAFQAMHVTVVPDAGNPALVAVIDVTANPIASSGDVVVRLKSLSEVRQRTKLTLFAPRGLEVAVATHSLDLDPWADAEVRTTIINRAALAGSRYPVFVTVEYDEADGHRAAMGTGMVEVTGPGSHGLAPAVFAVAAALMVVWILLVVRRRATGASDPGGGDTPP